MSFTKLTTAFSTPTSRPRPSLRAFTFLNRTLTFIFHHLPSPTSEQGLEEVAQQLESFGCQNCGGSAHEDSMILCDGCDLGYVRLPSLT
jgi:hypothetical protein